MKNKFVILIFLLAIISGLFWGWGDFHTAPEPGGDGPYYNEIALNFLNDHQLSYQGESINIAPGYPVFISTVYFFFGQNNYFAVNYFAIIILIAGDGRLSTKSRITYRRLEPVPSFWPGLMQMAFSMVVEMAPVRLGDPWI